MKQPFDHESETKRLQSLAQQTATNTVNEMFEKVQMVSWGGKGAKDKSSRDISAKDQRGHYAIVLDVPDPGRLASVERKWHSFEGTKREAQVECARLIANARAAAIIEPSKITIAQYIERWLDHVKSQVSPRSHERYCEIVRKNIIPPLGAVI